MLTKSNFQKYGTFLTLEGVERSDKIFVVPYTFFDINFREMKLEKNGTRIKYALKCLKEYAAESKSDIPEILILFPRTLVNLTKRGDVIGIDYRTYQEAKPERYKIIEQMLNMLL